MKLKCLAVFAALMLSVMTFPVLATHSSCLVQESTVFFVNGMYAEDSVEPHTNNLRKLLEKQGVSLDCVHTQALPNHDEPFNLDLLEATIQKTHELGVEFLHGFGMLVRFFIPDDWFLDGVVDEVYSRRAIGEISNADLDEHMLAYRAALAEGHRIILTCHSQGCLYTREAFFRMTPEERVNARWVTVVTPAVDVPERGPNTRLHEDAFAGLFFAIAPLPNVANAEDCAGNTRDRWTCHGMDTSYLHGANSREKIVNDIVAMLPTQSESAVVQGRTFRTLLDGSATVIEGNTSVYLVKETVQDIFDTIAETTSDANGFYMLNAPACRRCAISAQKIGAEPGTDSHGSTRLFEIVPRETYNVDVTMVTFIPSGG